MNFGMRRSNPSQTAPSSPTGLPSHSYFSAPASPRWNSNFPGAFQNVDPQNVHSDREERPCVSKPPKTVSMDEFAFATIEKPPGMRPLKPPPGLPSGDQFNWIKKSPMSSPKSERSPIFRGKKAFLNTFSPKTPQIDEDPFETAIENTRRSAQTRSHFQDSAFRFEERREEDDDDDEAAEEAKRDSKFYASPSASSSSSSSSKKPSSKKWRLKDFMRFGSIGRESVKFRSKIFRI